MMTFRLSCLFTLLAALSNGPAAAATAQVAVASNFAETAERLAVMFETETGDQVTIIRGSTGKLYAQAVSGAPFDALLAADKARPERLENEGHGLAGTRFTYAIGRLVLWQPSADTLEDGRKLLAQKDWRRLAIANPELAPYGLAARQALDYLGLWDSLDGRLVVGENIAQAWLFTASGNVDLGLVARAQTVARPDMAVAAWSVPANWHEPIIQQAIQLRVSATAAAFLDYLRSEAAREHIKRAGYDLPGRDD